MKEKWAPHIIAATAFVVFIVLGLACASTPNNADKVEFYGTWIGDDNRSIITISEKEIRTVTFDSAHNVSSQYNFTIVSTYKIFYNVDQLQGDKNLRKNYPKALGFKVQQDEIILDTYKGPKFNKRFYLSNDQQTLVVQRHEKDNRGSYSYKESYYKRANETTAADMPQNTNWATLHLAPYITSWNSVWHMIELEYLDGTPVYTEGVINIAEGKHKLRVRMANNMQSGNVEFEFVFTKGEQYIFEGTGEIFIFRKLNNTRLTENVPFLMW